MLLDASSLPSFTCLPSLTARWPPGDYPVIPTATSASRASSGGSLVITRRPHVLVCRLSASICLLSGTAFKSAPSFHAKQCLGLLNKLYDPLIYRGWRIRVISLNLPDYGAPYSSTANRGGQIEWPSVEWNCTGPYGTNSHVTCG